MKLNFNHYVQDLAENPPEGASGPEPEHEHASSLGSQRSPPLAPQPFVANVSYAFNPELYPSSSESLNNK
jgi:hypothetical protein